MKTPTEAVSVLVVEDEWPARNFLVTLLQESGLAEVTAAVATLDEAREALGPDGIAVDVAFVDVQLAGAARDDAGLALIRSLAGAPEAPLFVLATASDAHAVEAFDLGVVDYLLKPFCRERVTQCLQRVRQRLAAARHVARNTRIVARHKNGLVFLQLDEVWGFEAANRLTFVHTCHGRFDIDLSLSAVEASFGRTLVRVHRSWLVSAAHVRMLDHQGGEYELLVGGGLSGSTNGPELVLYLIFLTVVVTGMSAWLLIGGSAPLAGPVRLERLPHLKHHVIDVHDVVGLVALLLTVHHVGHRWSRMVRGLRSAWAAFGQGHNRRRGSTCPPDGEAAHRHAVSLSAGMPSEGREA